MPYPPATLCRYCSMPLSRRSIQTHERACIEKKNIAILKGYSKTFYGVYHSVAGNTRTDTNEACPLSSVHIEGQPHRFKLLKVGDVVRRLILPGRGNHGGTFRITKVNPKSINGIELEGSYSPGTLHNVSNRIADVGQYMKSLYIETSLMPHERLKELAQQGW